MTDKNELIVRQFLHKNKQTIPDNDFSEQVMRHLPEESSIDLARRWTWWCWAVMVIAVVVLALTGNLDITPKMPEQLTALFNNLQHPETVTHFLMTHLRYGMWTWFAMIAGAFTYAYQQFKSA